ncbi:hypothetical protein [Flagellimonas pacifica]|uniref:Uncharacterized protein n=1 Tax=Flagellimonas pacifica TaxID=1247520 RepID=A0A285MRY8_9FLAO|nr:hypothetical protein [Allomuricauda parva]SNY99930.1 hypothetical protein SAMN06265377_1745 [Allomuricauda parva]
MKTFTCLFFILCCISLEGQTIVKFEKPNQVYDFAEDYLLMKLIVKNETKEKILPFSLTIYTDEKKDILLYPKTSSKGIDIMINGSKNEEIVQIPINKKEASKINHLTLRLSLNNKNQNVNLTESTHTIVFKKPRETTFQFKKIHETTSIKRPTQGKLYLPYTVESSTIAPKKNDSVKLIMKINGINSKLLVSPKTDTIPIRDMTTKGKFLIKFLKNEDTSFGQSMDSLLENDKVELELIDVKHASTIKAHVSKERKTKKISFKDSILTTSFGSNRYNFFIGTNFDLRDRFEANSFYSEIDVFLPDLSNKGAGKIGIRAGIYKNNSVSTLAEYARNAEVLEIVEGQTTSDTIAFERNRVRSVPNVSIENLGLYFQAFFTLKEKKNKNFNFRLMLGGHVEVIERTETTNLSNENLFSFGTEKIATSSLIQNDTLQAKLAASSTRTIKFYDSHYGITLPMFFQSKEIEVFLNPILGIGNPGNRERLNTTSVKTFGVAQFYLLERKYGVKLSGDVRKYFASGQTPIITISLSKTINLSSLFSSNN